VTQLRRSIDEFDVDRLELNSGSSGMEGLSEDQRSLLGADAGSLDHDVIVLDDSVVRETTEGSDVLLGQVVLSGSVILNTVNLTLADAVDSLVGLSSVVVAELTGTGDGPSDTFGMPRADATNSSETSVSLSGQLLDTESLNDTGESVTLGDTKNVDVLEVTEDLVNLDFLLEERLGEVDLLSNASTVDLDFQNVGLLLLEVEELSLSVADDSDNSGVLLNSVKKDLQSLRAGSELLFVLLEAFPLAAVPVLVETSLELGAQGLGPNAGQASESTDGLDVTDNTDNSDGRGFENGDSLDNFLLVELGTGSLNFSDDVGHTGLETDEGGQMGLLRSIVFREGSYAASVVAGSALGDKTEVSSSGSFEFSVRHLIPFIKIRAVFELDNF